MRFDDLKIICNGCGNEMTQMGLWPLGKPTDLTSIGASRYACENCKVNSRPMIVSIVEPDIIIDNVPQEDGSIKSKMVVA